jgi:hypothetical protein
MMRRIHLILAVLIAPLVASSGCGRGDAVWVTGKLLKGGTQYVPPTDQNVSITFFALEDASGKAVEGEPNTAEYDRDSGTFTVPGPERRGISPGKYRVAVTQKLTREAYDAKAKTAKTAKTRPQRDDDTLGGQFGLEKSPITVKVSRSEEVTIDLDKPQG